jgi:phage/plasmid-associated DNA primase
MQSFVPQAHLHILCNKMPTVDGEDGGMQNRTRVADYISKYVKKEEVDIDNNRFELIETFSETLKAWRDDTILILLSEYSDVENPVPNEVKHSTIKYLKANNDSIYFVDEYLEKGTETDYITMKEVMEIWRHDDQCRSLKMKQSQVADMLEKALKTPCKDKGKMNGVWVRSYFVGWKLRQDNPMDFGV